MAISTYDSVHDLEGYGRTYDFAFVFAGGSALLHLFPLTLVIAFTVLLGQCRMAWQGLRARTQDGQMHHVVGLATSIGVLGIFNARDYVSMGALLVPISVLVLALAVRGNAEGASWRTIISICVVPAGTVAIGMLALTLVR